MEKAETIDGSGAPLLSRFVLAHQFRGVFTVTRSGWGFAMLFLLSAPHDAGTRVISERQGISGTGDTQ